MELTHHIVGTVFHIDELLHRSIFGRCDETYLAHEFKTPLVCNHLEVFKSLVQSQACS